MMTSLLRRRLQRLRDQGERGSILILVVLSALIIVGSAGLAVDIGRLYATKAELSRAVDAAALSGVLEFNGTAGGLTNASTKACSYLQANEPGASCSGIVPDGTTSTLRIQASKSVRLFFMPIFGINTASVSAKAISGFNNATVDSVIVLDATGSMDGTPIQQAKIAANNFKNTLLGSSPSGNVVIGINSFRGCWRATSSTSATYPMASSKANCAPASEVTGLTSNATTLTNGINAICPSDNCTGGSGTNVCGGLAKGWEVLEGAGNHTSSQNNRRFLILQSDGDNNYNGAYSYQASLLSPYTYQTHPCAPPSSCGNVGGTSTSASDPCRDGTYTSGTITVASETFETNNFSGGTGWAAASWTLTSTPETLSGSAQAGTYKARLNQTDAISRSVNLSAVYDASIRYYIRTSGTWATSDRAYFETSPDGSTWTTRATYGISGSGQTVISSSYNSFTVSLTSLVGDSSAYVRFRTNTSTSSKYIFLDSITVTDPNSSSDGYLNGTDNSASCGNAVKRERQVDMITRDMATAIKADGIEIFVVAFGVCSSNTTVMTSTDCSTNVGNTDNDNTSDQRLLKCIASSTSGTNDHYFYAATAAALPQIFTTIAAQIAHRLVE